MHTYLHHRPHRGFTLIEILVVIGMLALLSTITLVAINPLRQFAQARNTERQNDVAQLLNAVSERIVDNGGLFATTTDPAMSSCAINLPSTTTPIGNASPGEADLYPCLTPQYIATLPHDPTTGTNDCPLGSYCGSNIHYDLGYTIAQNNQTNQITVCAPAAAESAIPGSQPFCLSR